MTDIEAIKQLQNHNNFPNVIFKVILFQMS